METGKPVQKKEVRQKNSRLLLKRQGQRRKQADFFVLLLALLFFANTPAQVVIEEAFPSLTFENPVDLQHAGDSSNRIFVVEQEGRIRVFNNSPDVPGSQVFLDITDRIVSGGEMGLLGLAFHPDYESNGYFYVNYTKPSPLQTRISRFKVSQDANAADPESEEILLTFNQPYQNHNGGQIAFGPDGYLYIATGDGGSSGDPNNNAQNLNSLLGKILRIDVDNTDDTLHYAIPADNPFVSIDTARHEVYAYGLRNPWRFSFDSSGRLWAADVGQNAWEEIDIIEKGGNYGWRIMEGNHCYSPSSGCDTSGLILPVHEYNHNNSGGYSITGGYVYEGSSLPSLEGKYIFADYVSRRIWSLDTDNYEAELIASASDGVPSFGIDENKELYFCSFDGKIYKFREQSTGVNDNNNIADDYVLHQNYPNPFNPATMLDYYIPEESSVRLEIISVNGELVTVLTDGVKQQGHYSAKWNAADAASGVYYARMSAVSLLSGKSAVRIQKIMLLK
jgi:glucose/arabinose dehydrogenase